MPEHVRKICNCEQFTKNAPNYFQFLSRTNQNAQILHANEQQQQQLGTLNCAHSLENPSYKAKGPIYFDRQNDYSLSLSSILLNTFI